MPSINYIAEAACGSCWALGVLVRAQPLAPGRRGGVAGSADIGAETSRTGPAATAVAAMAVAPSEAGRKSHSPERCGGCW
mmetsp:Transcript_56652/g.122445  ORF Transcript_56652/g.122445 Transcript_56652/m.122445 type:complete len:80 (+) Transcript_56652:118-357(+)